jgi:hypothetical protein
MLPHSLWTEDFSPVGVHLFDIWDRPVGLSTKPLTDLDTHRKAGFYTGFRSA